MATISKTKKKEMRIKVAQDVLYQLSKKKYKASPGTYCRLNLKDNQELTVNAELQTELTKVKNCEVCGIGAAFLSLVRIDDKFKVCHNDTLDNCINDIAMREKLYKYFDEDEIENIEDAFEGFSGYFEYLDKYPDPTKRLRAIMRNIIKNGEFIKD